MIDMGETLLTVMGLVIVIGFAVAVIAYKPVRNRIIATKGYDADKSGKLLAMASIGLPLLLGFNMVRDVKVLVLLFLVPFAINVVLRIGKIGVGNAILITVLQTFGIIWVILKGAYNIFKKATGAAERGGNEAIARRNADEAKKAELMREYEAKVARIERGSDEISDLTGETDAAIAAARDDYEREVSKVDHEYKG